MAENNLNKDMLNSLSSEWNIPQFNMVKMTGIDTKNGFVVSSQYLSLTYYYFSWYTIIKIIFNNVKAKETTNGSSTLINCTSLWLVFFVSDYLIWVRIRFDELSALIS